MKRYPDQIIILKPINTGNPYETPSYEQVYTGACRCFLDRQAAFRTNRVMDCDYQVVIPDRNMVEIGENYKVGVKMHTNPSTMNWDLVGYVKDFARYDRVCNLYFQMVKENLVYEDIPAPAIDPDKRVLGLYDDEWVHIESTGYLDDSHYRELEPIVFVAKKTGYQMNLYSYSAVTHTYEVLGMSFSDWCVQTYDSYTTKRGKTNLAVGLYGVNYDGGEAIYSHLLVRATHMDVDSGQMEIDYEKRIDIVEDK